MIELKVTALEASGEDWGVRVQRIIGRPVDACPWYWSAWTKAGGGHVEWEGESPTQEAAEQNAIGTLERLQEMVNACRLCSTFVRRDGLVCPHG